MSINFSLSIESVQSYLMDENDKEKKQVFREKIAHFELGNWHELRAILPHDDMEVKHITGTLSVKTQQVIDLLAEASAKRGWAYHTWDPVIVFLRKLQDEWFKNKDRYQKESYSFIYDLKLTWG